MFPPAPAPAPKQPTLISEELLYKLAAAHARLHQLKSMPVPEGQAEGIAHAEEVKLLTEQVSAVFLMHAPEFLGAIFVLKQEYSPLVRAFGPLVRHAIMVSGESASPLSDAAQAEVIAKNE